MRSTLTHYLIKGNKGSSWLNLIVVLMSTVRFGQRDQCEYELGFLNTGHGLDAVR